MIRDFCKASWYSLVFSFSFKASPSAFPHSSEQHMNRWVQQELPIIPPCSLPQNEQGERFHSRKLSEPMVSRG
jgi:hypothetical protein